MKHSGRTVLLVALVAVSCGASPVPQPEAPPPRPAAAPPAPATLIPAAASADAIQTAADPSPARAPSPIPPNTAVLHVGDSFALAGFAQGLKPHMLALRVRYEVKAETSSFTTTWAPKMELLVANTQPDLVIITLGANEVGNVDPPSHAGAVRRIVRAVGNRPCVWVAPPLWGKETGIIEVIRENSAPCRFFDSNTLVKEPIPRQGDHIHPTDKGGAIWADAFWTWLEAERAADGDPASGGTSPWRLKPSPPEEHRAK